MRLPAGHLREFLGGGAFGPFQQVQDLLGFAALAGSGRLRRSLGVLAGLAPFFAELVFLAACFWRANSVISRQRRWG